MAIQAEHLRHTRDVVVDLIAADTGQPAEQVEADSRRDRWFTAEEAVAYGFVDRVLADSEDVRAASVTARPVGLVRR